VVISWGPAPYRRPGGTPRPQWRGRYGTPCQTRIAESALTAVGRHWAHLKASILWELLSVGSSQLGREIPAESVAAYPRPPVEPEVANKASELPACVGAIPEDHHCHASAPARYPLFTLSAKADAKTR
jgi:hypothetical protein